MKKFLYFLCVAGSTAALTGQIFVPEYNNRANIVTLQNTSSLLQEFASFGTKTTGSAANTNTLNWLKGKYQSYGYAAAEIVESPFISGNFSSKNLVVTKTGTLYPDTYVIVCGHFDTINGPGVSDNGSGTSVILQAAQILRYIPTEYSIKFIHFSGEEQGLLGSSHYVNNVLYQNGVKQFNVKLVFNIDQVGGKIGNLNNNIKCESDNGGQFSSNNAASLAFTQQLAVCTSLYSPLSTTFASTYASDYVPFENKGEIITGFYETIRSYNEHSANDTYANIDPVYVTNVAKAAVGAIQHFAVAAATNLSTNEVAADDYLISVFPNPAKDILHIKFKNSGEAFSVAISDVNGRLISESQNTHSIDLSGIVNGMYYATIKTDRQTVTKKFMVQK